MNGLLRVAAGPPRAVLLATLLLLAALGFAIAAQAAAPAEATREPYCYSWDFLNNTGADADQLIIRLDRVRQVTTLYEGVDNPFGNPLPSSGYDSATDSYALAFGGGLALDSLPVRLGACLDRGMLRLSANAGAAFQWGAGGQPVEPDPLFLGLTWNRPAAGGVSAELSNDSGIPLVILSLSLVRLDAPLALEDLTADTLALQPALAELDEPQLLAPGESTQFALPQAAWDPAWSHGAVGLRVEFAAEDDLGNIGHLNAQLLDAQKTLLPVTLR
jgi:hypothetical protein